MPAPLSAWYSLRDIEAFAQRRAVLSGEIELNRFKRLRDLLHADEGRVRVSLKFAPRGESWQAVQLQYEAVVSVVCQRCLEPVELELADDRALGIVPTAALEEALPAGYEPVVLENDRLCPAHLLEDELIVALPLVPKHAAGERCESLAERYGSVAAGETLESSSTKRGEGNGSAEKA